MPNETAIANRKVAVGRFASALICGENALANPDYIPRFLVWCERIEDVYNSFNNAHLQIVTGVSDEQFDIETQLQDDIDEKYVQIMALKKTLIKKDDNFKGNEKYSKAKLPRMELPSFSGEIKDWQTFIDLYDSLIHNDPDMSDMEKFQYLSISLTGPAKTIIKKYPLSAANYKSAYDAIKARYDNQRSLSFLCWEQIANAPMVKKSTELRKLLDTMTENITVLKNMGLPTENWDFVLFYTLITKVDQESRDQFEFTVKGKDIPSFKELHQFMLDRCDALERSHMKNKTDTTQPKPTTNSRFKQPSHTLVVEENDTSLSTAEEYYAYLAQANANMVCPLCDAAHSVMACGFLKDLSPEDRFKLIKQKSLCTNCLRSSHSVKECKSTNNCKTCNKRHHTLLHFPTTRPEVALLSTDYSTLPSNNVENHESETIHTLTNSIKQPMMILLATAEVAVKTKWGATKILRALLDSGSQATLITDSCVQKLGLKQTPINTSIHGIGQVATRPSGLVRLEISSSHSTEPTFTVDAISMSNLCGNQPRASIDPDSCKHFNNLKLADPLWYSTQSVDLIIGAEIFPHLLLPGHIQSEPNGLVAMNTVLGWVIMGTITDRANTQLNALCLNVTLDLDIQIEKLWEMEDIPQATQSLTLEEQLCEDIYQETHRQTEDGRYCVDLPFRSGEPEFSGSFNIAKRRFIHQEKRLLANPSLYEDYKSCLEDYLKQDHMEPVPPELKQKPSAYYIPHHAVVKPERETTKVRVVFDASARDEKGLSLNDSLLIGPKLQADLVGILLRFRTHAFVFTADVCKMYRQIQVSNKHLDYQRILFRFDPEAPIEEYRLKTVTFGVSAAPYLAIKTLQQLAIDQKDLYPIAHKVIMQDVYVDDVVSGSDTLLEAIDAKNQLITAMSNAGFELRKWSSNNPNFLDTIEPAHRANPNVSFDDSFVKVLGLQWQASDDQLFYNINPIQRPCTKRNMLSELARIFDPLGFLCPLTFLAKSLIQKLWLLGTSWDDPVPDSIDRIWIDYIQQLPNLTQIRIPRRITQENGTYDLHGFCDASESGYAAVIYLRTVQDNQVTSVSLICAKSRVAPVKRKTLPRLELCAASLLANLMNYVLSKYSNVIDITAVNGWSDSEIALAWLQSPSSRWKTFVANRVANIQSKVPNAIWRHVPSKQNPADCGSRGMLPNELISHDLWWNGPHWLFDNPTTWPPQKDLHCLPQAAINEEKHILIVEQDMDIFQNLMKRFSSLNKILRIIACCKRFYQKACKKIQLSAGITQLEIDEAMLLLVGHTQKSSFQKEVELLKQNKVLPKAFRKLSPFLDKNQLIRVGGRLRRSELNYEAKHPLLLPAKHRLTRLIIEHVHQENCHPGSQTLHYLIRQRYWIFSARQAIKSIISKCLRCFRTKPATLQPYMADLPKLRVTQVKAFQIVGCDYGGPFNVTVGHYRGARRCKAYLCLFVCFATKALHLELVSDLSTEAFLAALRRFISRRGRCNIIHSDCGTNFVGARNQLTDLMSTACTQEHIEFKLNPPSSPHFGGIFEAGIKSVKTHLYRVIGAQTLTFEELTTVLVQVEALLNSRPLCEVSSDPEDEIEVLTPGHFLTLAPLTALPEHNYQHIQMNRLSRWQLLQRLHQDFWDRWHHEYLNSLSQRLKWNTLPDAVKVGTVVIVKDELTSPLRWRYGRIEALHPGSDGLVRVVTVRTADGMFKRPIVKLCPVPSCVDC